VWGALENNGIILKLLHLLRDKRTMASEEPLLSVAKIRIFLFVLVQIVVAGASIAISQTIAAVGFPLLMLALVPFRATVMNKWFTREELNVLDHPTASKFTVASLGGIPYCVGGDEIDTC